MEKKELLYRLALAAIPGIGPVYAKKLLDHFGNAEAIFRADYAALAEVNGIGGARANAITSFHQFPAIEKELAFIEKYAIRCLFFTDKDYPQRLLRFKEAPILLFYKGNADLNSRRIVSVIGTRTPTEYGRQATERLIRELAVYGPLVISGLAYGIDATAHKAALKNSLPTVGILGHGLDRIYPPQHKTLAAEMIKNGGLLTNFNTNVDPDFYNFPLRNKIVAGISDALIVAETDVKGGSMLTVGNALNYQQRIFAFPGRLTDKTSSGCNKLIQEGSARLLSHASQLIAEMGWGAPEKAAQATLFPSPAEENLSTDEKTVLHLLKEKEKSSVDQLSAQTLLSGSAIAIALLHLELQGLVISLPGKMYRLAV